LRLGSNGLSCMKMKNTQQDARSDSHADKFPTA
jgi:hypothetical protein